MGHENVEAENKFLQAPFSEEERKLINTLVIHPEGIEVIKDHEDKVKLVMWEDEQRNVLEEKHGNTSHIWLDWRKGLLYFEGGFIDEAFKSLRAAHVQATNESETDLLDAIEADIAKLETQIYQ